MKTTQTTLCIIESTDNTSGGNALEKAARAIFDRYDHALIDEADIPSLEQSIRDEIENILNNHKAYKRIELKLTRWQYCDWLVLELGMAGIRFRPAKYIVGKEG